MDYAFTLLSSAVSGIIGTICAALIGRWKIRHDITTVPTMPLASQRKWRWTIPAITGITCLILGGLGGYLFSFSLLTNSESCSPIGGAGGAITSPAETAMVERETIVYGKACHIPSGSTVWLLADSATRFQGYYIEAGPISTSVDGLWSATAYIGDQTNNDVGHSYKLVFVLADQAGTINLATTKKDAQNDRILLQFPPGVQVLTDILVIRGQ